MNYAVEQRMRFIDWILQHYNSIAREQLTDFFGISGPTATRDFAAYKKLAPANMVFDDSSKQWCKAPNFKRVYE